MNATTVADSHWHITETQRLTRSQFERWFAKRQVDLVVMEACGSAHFWARWLNGLGIEVRADNLSGSNACRLWRVASR